MLQLELVEKLKLSPFICMYFQEKLIITLEAMCDQKFPVRTALVKKKYFQFLGIF
jgi:hypothetical protein